MQTESFSPQDSLKLIQNMIIKARHDMSDNSVYFLLWGWITFVACVSQFILLKLKYLSWYKSSQSVKQNKKSIEWLKNYEDKGVLLISDNSKDETIAAINLLNIDNKIRFDINHSKARWGGVKISSKLADLAITVHP